MFKFSKGTEFLNILTIFVRKAKMHFPNIGSNVLQEPNFGVTP
jgi:hypothetical protein